MKNFISICCTAVIFLICFGVVYPYIGTFAEGDETSGYINNVQCIREINTGEELSSLASSDTDIAIVRVNGGGTLSLGAETAPFDAQDFGGAVPAFYVDDEASAAAAASLIAEQSPYAFVVSGSAALVRQVRERCNTAGGIVDFRGRELSALNMRNEVNENLAKSALVAAGQLNAEDVQLLKKLFVNVYTAADSEEECIRALACGADGVLCPDAELLSEALCKGAETGIYAPRPFVVSHRGSSQATRQGRAYYENTVAAARAAYDAYHPDFVEIDLYLSADGYVVISHDATLDRMTTGTGSIESMTLAQIRQYKVDGGLGESAEYLDEIAVLDDYFEEFQNDGLMFLLEIKSAKTECVDAALALIKNTAWKAASTLFRLTARSSPMPKARNRPYRSATLPTAANTTPCRILSRQRCCPKSIRSMHRFPELGEHGCGGGARAQSIRRQGQCLDAEHGGRLFP